MPHSNRITTGRRVLPHDPDVLKLGKGVSFVKTRLLRVRQEKDTWEADIYPVPCDSGDHPGGYLGIVLSHDGYLPREAILIDPPTVNTMASFLADAMLRPFDGLAHRPAVLFLRDRPEWSQLVPHLKQLKIDVQLVKTLKRCDRLARESIASALEIRKELERKKQDKANKKARR